MIGVTVTLHFLNIFFFYSYSLSTLTFSFSQDDFFLGKCFEAMEVDSLSSSHPISTPVENPTQIQEMFDDVSYDKVSLALSEDSPFGVDALGYWNCAIIWALG